MVIFFSTKRDLIGINTINVSYNTFSYFGSIEYNERYKRNNIMVQNHFVNHLLFVSIYNYIQYKLLLYIDYFKFEKKYIRTSTYSDYSDYSDYVIMSFKTFYNIEKLNSK